MCFFLIYYPTSFFYKISENPPTEYLHKNTDWALLIYILTENKSIRHIGNQNLICSTTQSNPL